MTVSSVKEMIRRGVSSTGVKTFAAFAGSNFLVSIINGFGGLLQARWVAPETFGEIQKYGILTTYLSIGILVVNDGLIRQYPYYIGKGQKEKALEVAGVAKWWFAFVGYLIGGFFTVMSLAAALRGDWRAACGWGVQITGTAAATYGIYLGIMYRTSSDFRRLAANNLLNSIVGFAALGLVRLWDYFGLACRMVSLSMVSLLINRYYVPVKVKAIFNLRELWRLSKISLRFSLPAYFHSSFLLASRRALILYYCFQTGLGLYSFAAALSVVVNGFSTALSQILNVKITTRFGETEDLLASFKSSLKPSLCGLALSIALIAICWFAMPFMVERFIPKYAEAIPCFRVLSFNLINQAFALPLLVFKAALMWKTAAFQALTNFAATVLLIFVLPKTITMVALATVLGCSAEIFIGYAALFLACRKKYM